MTIKENAAALRFLMAGSVDDGKSTLTGRLLYECKAVPADQLEALERKAVDRELDFSLLADGLEAEREQGITIDVAHRYFATAKRKFIIADAPGHEEYTRNMVTAASNSDAAVILVDITKLDLSKDPVVLLPQTYRHGMLIRLLDVRSIIFAVNKIDAVGDPPSAFAKVRDAIFAFARNAHLGIAGILPMSARMGDNVAQRSYDWFDGPSLLELLEELPAGAQHTAGDLLLPVQYVSRIPITRSNGFAHANSERIFWGRVARGAVRAGDEVQVFPSNQRASVISVHIAGEEVESASAEQSAGLVLDRQVDAARGSWLAAPDSVETSDRFSATLVWMDNEPGVPGRKYLIRHGTQWLQGRIATIESCLDIHTLGPKSVHAVSLNDIAEVVIETAEAVPLAPYRQNRAAGAMLVVDNSTHRTSGVLLVTKVRWDAAPDRRGDHRVFTDIPVSYHGAHGKGRGTIENIGIGGLMMVVAEAPSPVGGDVELSFDLMQQAEQLPVKVTARVVGHVGAGDAQVLCRVAFSDIELSAYQALSRFVRDQ